MLNFTTADHPDLFKQLVHDSLHGLRGMERVAKITLACALAKWRGQRQESHHVLLQATNGVAKSTLAENVNRALLGPELVKHYESNGERVALRRVQGNPELMPSDLVGGDMLGGGKQLVFKHGPLTAPDPPTFLVMADEINRTGPRTMSGWLQAMAEGHCTVRSLALDEPTLRFVPGWVIATQNPAQHVGTYPLPEAAYDRFMTMLIVGMTPELDKLVCHESVLSTSKGSPKNKPESDTEKKSFREEARRLFEKREGQIEEAKTEIGQMKLEDGLCQFIARLCYWTWPLDAVRRLRIGTEELVCPYRDVREAIEPLAQGVSPRAAKALRDLGCAMAWAFKHELVTRDLIEAIAEPVLSHRLVLRRSVGAGQEGVTETIVRTVVKRVRDDVRGR